MNHRVQEIAAERSERVRQQMNSAAEGQQCNEQPAFQSADAECDEILQAWERAAVEFELLQVLQLR